MISYRIFFPQVQTCKQSCWGPPSGQVYRGTPKTWRNSRTLHDALSKHHYHDGATISYYRERRVGTGSSFALRDYVSRFRFVLGSLRSGAVVSEIHIHIQYTKSGGFQEINLVAIKDRIRRLDHCFFFFFLHFSYVFYGFVFIVLQHQRRRRRDRISIGTKLVAVPKLRSARPLASPRH